MTFPRTKIMGILNVTPDSFSDGGQFIDLDVAVKAALRLIDEGAQIIDIGGESTRPGAELVPMAEELQRVIPVIAALREAVKDFDIEPQISIDTRKADVAEAAILAGADIWNDVSGLTFDPRSEHLAADLGCPVILMHAQGSPDTMQDNPQYGDAVFEVKDWLAKRIDACGFAGIERKNIIIDPGIGFGKRQKDNLMLLARLQELQSLECPILMGASRKSFIGCIDGSSADDRLGGSVAAALWSVQHGASILRVHDVRETVQAVRVWEAMQDFDAK